MLSHSVMSGSLQPLWTVARQAPLSLGFPRQEYWSGLPFLLPGDLPKPGTELLSLMSPASAGGFFTIIIAWEARATWEAYFMHKPPQFLGLPGGSDGKESTCNAADLGSIPGLGRSARDENGYPLQYSGFENSTDTGAWQATVHGVARVGHDRATFTFPNSTPDIPLSQKKSTAWTLLSAPSSVLLSEVGPPDYNIFCFYQGNMIHKIFLH